MVDVGLCLLIAFFTLMAILLIGQLNKSGYANSPYTTPYMMEVISPWAEYKCINKPTTYVVDSSWAFT